jgi:hypothetical protein
MHGLLAVVLQVASLTVSADTGGRVFVGDPVVALVVVRLRAGATLVDQVPRTRDTLPSGVRVLSADTLRQEGGEWVGRVRLGFFRPDSQAVPALAVAYRVGNAVDTAFSAPIEIVVQRLTDAPNATLRDIREIDTPVIPWGWIWAGLVVLAAAVGSVVVRRRALAARARRATLGARVDDSGVARAPGPLEVALGQLAEIEAAGWDRERQAVAAADVVRGYLERARGIPAMERTTAEVRALVVPDGRLIEFLTTADLVKFARRRPEAGFVERARAVLRGLAA